MSRTKGLDSEVRAENDDYPTPPLLAQTIVRRLAYNWRGKGSPLILEPSAGGGNFVRAARAGWPESDITAVEINVRYEQALVEAGATEVIPRSLESSVAELPKFDLIVGNPPFRSAEEHVRLLVPLLAPGGSLAFLLRINFLGSEKRVPFWKEYPPDEIWPIAPRPSFTGTGSDGTEYGVFVWTKIASSMDYNDGGVRLDWLTGPTGWK